MGSEQSGGMETGEGGAQNSLEGWKQVRVGLRTVWRDRNRGERVGSEQTRRRETLRVVSE